MLGRDPRTARLLGLWTAAWLGGLLFLGLLWVGNLALEWPVLLIPLVWALVAIRPRGGRAVPPPHGPAVSPHRSDTVEQHAVRPPETRRHRDE